MARCCNGFPIYLCSCARFGTFLLFYCVYCSSWLSIISGTKMTTGKVLRPVIFMSGITENLGLINRRSPCRSGSANLQFTDSCYGEVGEQLQWSRLTPVRQGFNSDGASNSVCHIDDTATDTFLDSLLDDPIRHFDGIVCRRVHDVVIRDLQSVLGVYLTCSAICLTIHVQRPRPYSEARARPLSWKHCLF